VDHLVADAARVVVEQLGHHDLVVVPGRVLEGAAAVHRAAMAGPACPEPTAMASTCSAGM
jgi:hypothetical protein